MNSFNPIALILMALTTALQINGQVLNCNATTSCPTGSTCLTYSSCQQGTCTCMKGWNRNSTAESLFSFGCIQAQKKIGENCSVSEECLGTYATCSSSKCSCVVGYTAKSDMTDCLPGPLGANCTFGSDSCGYLAECSNGVCQCQKGKKKTDTYNCIPFVLGDACNVTDCPNNAACPYASCQNGTYQCVDGYQWFVSVLQLSSCILKNATVNSAGKLCDIQGSSSSVCSANLTCSLCPENMDVATGKVNYTCVGLGNFMDVMAPTSSPSGGVTVATTASNTSYSNVTSMYQTSKKPDNSVSSHLSAVSKLFIALMLLVSLVV